MNPNKLISIANFSPISLQKPNAWVGHLPFAAWLIQEVAPKIFVELGTHSGNSYFSFCQSVAANEISTKCYAVDTWQGDEHAGQYDDQVFIKVNAHNEEHYAGFSRLLRMTFDDAATYFADESIDILHIDGLHTYEAVRHDFETWLPKLAAGAVVVLHDINVRERHFGVWKLWEELQERYPNNLEFLHSHGLGVLQLNNAPDIRKLDWLQFALPEKQNLRIYFASLGAVQLDRFAFNELEQSFSEMQQTMESRLSELQKTVGERDRQIVNLTRRHNELNSALKETLSSTSWRITSPLRAVKRLRAAPRAALSRLRRVIAAINDRNSSDAAAMAIARTGRHPSAAYLAAIAPLDITRIKASQHTSPKYSIVILQYNQAQLTINCIRSIIRNTYLDNVEIIVVDNGSNIKELAKLSPYLNIIKLLEVGINRYYGEGNNLGAEVAKGEFIILMNNDIAVTDGWLETISAELTEGIGAVGPCFLYPDDVIQEAGGFIAADGNAEQRFKRQGVEVLPQEPFACDYVSGALLLIRKSDFVAVGGFGLCWEPAYYEDVDLCLKLRLLGLKTICCPNARIYHVENATSSDRSLKLGLENIVEVNKSKFIDRWGAFLSGDALQLLPTKPGFSSAKSINADEPKIPRNKPRALIYTPFAMTPGGGERYILSIAAALSESYEVTIAFTHAYSSIRIRQLGEYFELHLDDLRSTTLDEALSEKNTWELAFILGNSLFPSMPAPALHSFYICQFPFDHKTSRNRWHPFEDEYTYISYSKFVSSFVARSMDSVAAKEICVLYPPVKIFSGSEKKNKKIISIGRFFTGGHCKNQHLLIESFIKMSKQNPDLLAGWELVLTGSTRPEPAHRKYFADCQAQARGYPIRILPDASSDVLEKELADASIYWHGAGIGVDVASTPECVEHFGITPLEAASAGCLVIVHNSGGTGELAEQFPDCIFSYSLVEELQRLTMQLMQKTPEDISNLRELTKAAAARYSYVNFESKLFQAIRADKF
jgi:GT2 family glycosyltransferase/glycosyltransferase involved in cell wall biosynthesis